MFEIADSVGLEFEFPNSLRNILGNKLINGWKTVHDASSETAGIFINTGADYIPIMKEDAVDFPFPNILNVLLTGGEVVSPVLDIKNSNDVNSIIHTCKMLAIENAEFDDRCSFHVHVNVSKEYPLYALKNLVRIILAMEKFLYRVSGFNEVNRGVKNHFLFQRPFRSPQYLHVKDKYYIPSFSVDYLLDAETREDFWLALCNTGNNKYNPARYCGVSLPSIVLRGSAEFRYGNMCFDFKTIRAFTNLCRNIVKASFNISLPDVLMIERPMDVLEDSGEYFYDEYREILQQYLFLDNADVEVLMKLYRTLPNPVMPSDKPLVTHLDAANNATGMFPRAFFQKYATKVGLVNDVNRGSDIYVRGDAIKKEEINWFDKNIDKVHRRNPDNLPEDLHDFRVTKNKILSGFHEHNGYKIHLKFIERNYCIVLVVKDNQVIFHNSFYYNYRPNSLKAVLKEN